MHQMVKARASPVLSSILIAISTSRYHNSPAHPSRSIPPASSLTLRPCCLPKGTTCQRVLRHNDVHDTRLVCSPTNVLVGTYHRDSPPFNSVATGRVSEQRLQGFGIPRSFTNRLQFTEHDRISMRGLLSL